MDEEIKSKEKLIEAGTETNTNPVSGAFQNIPASSEKIQKSSKVLLILGMMSVILATFVISYLAYLRISKSKSSQPATSQQTKTETFEAKATFVEGDIWFLKDGRKTQVLEGDIFKEGDYLETGTPAKLTLELTNGSSVRLSENTKITISDFTKASTVLDQDQGVVFVRVTQGTGEFKVVAGDVEVTALGTAFSVEKDEEVQVGVYESGVLVKENDKEVEVQEGKEWKQGATEAVKLNTQSLADSEFLQWSMDQELKRIESEIIAEIQKTVTSENKEEIKQALENANIDKKELLKQAFEGSAQGTVSSITLQGTKEADGSVKLSWSANGLAQNGYKVVWSRNSGVTYPGDGRTSNPLYGYEKHLLMKPGTTWYFKVCEIIGEGCGVYSNEVSFSF